MASTTKLRAPALFCNSRHHQEQNYTDDLLGVGLHSPMLLPQTAAN